jgi:hypothetical protein
MIKFKLWSSVFLLFLLACNQEDNQPIDSTTQATAIHFTSTVKGVALTRANGASWTVNDSIGVYMKKSGESLSAGSIVNSAANFFILLRMVTEISLRQEPICIIRKTKVWSTSLPTIRNEI